MPFRPSSNLAENARFCSVVALMAACFLWGGGSRFDIPGLILLQPFAVLCALAVILLPGPMRWDVARAPLAMLAALATILAVQLIPLPPSMWSALPGHAQMAPFIAESGADNAWRPLSVAPDLTLASLVGLVVPLAMLVGVAGLSEAASHKLLSWLLIAAALGTLLGIGQLVGGPGSAFYRYAITNAGAAVGFFANRNHQALFLVAVWPMLAVWATLPLGSPNERRFRRWTALAAAIALLPMIVVTGSRAGLVLAAVGLIAGWWLGRDRERRTAVVQGHYAWIHRTAPLLVGLVLIAAAIVLSRAEAVDRLFSTNLPDEARLSYLPVLSDIAADFFPFGTGFGAFDPVFRLYEPDWALKPTYLNHAHNDLLELLITGGVPAVLLGATFLVWVALRLKAVWPWSAASVRRRFALLGGAIVLILALGSVVDYPLRTPLMAMLLALACMWLAGTRDREAPAGE